VALAERCFEIATTALRESGDHALAAAVYAHWSFVPGFAGTVRRLSRCSTLLQGTCALRSRPTVALVAALLAF
jgi:hypothetical protein